MRRILPILLAFVLLSCSKDDPVKPPETTYSITEAFPNLTFDRLMEVEDPDDGTNRLFAVEQRGFIRHFDNSPGAAASSLYLDIEAQVGLLDYGEKGLLSMIFDPLFATNGIFYVYYTATSKVDSSMESRLSRFTASPPSANQVNANTEEIVLSFPQPNRQHNGGELAWDAQGYLYLSLGDGGVNQSAQNLRNLLGSVIRIDVSTTPYSIPPGNPYTAPDRPEIFAHGFRNPWRMSIDPLTGMIFLGDVGEAKYEEVDIVEVGKNYGWNCREGFHPNDFCVDSTGFTEPIWEYSHADGNAILGGYVYRDSKMTGLIGKYVYADYISGKLWALTFDGAVSNELLIPDMGIVISSIGRDRNGEMYVCEWAGTHSRIFKVQQTTK